jgi:hypothetical protein
MEDELDVEKDYQTWDGVSEGYLVAYIDGVYFGDAPDKETLFNKVNIHGKRIEDYVNISDISIRTIGFTQKKKQRV